MWDSSLRLVDLRSLLDPRIVNCHFCVLGILHLHPNYPGFPLNVWQRRVQPVGQRTPEQTGGVSWLAPRSVWTFSVTFINERAVNGDWAELEPEEKRVSEVTWACLANNTQVVWLVHFLGKVCFTTLCLIVLESKHDYTQLRVKSMSVSVL